MYEWIAANQDGESVSFMCRVLGVWRTRYYRHIRQAVKGNERDAMVLSELVAIHQEHPEYGTERARRLLSEGERCSDGKAYRLRKEQGLMARRHRKRRSLTKRNPEDQLSEDLLQRDFKAAEPGKKWLGDITQTQCKDGKLYISGVYHPPTVLTIFALNMKYAREDAAMIAQNIQLAAHFLGVGACYVGRTDEVFDTDCGRELRRRWAIADDLVPVGNVLLGYREGPEPRAKPRKEGRILRV